MFQSEKQRLQLLTWTILLLLLAISAFHYEGNGDDTYWHIKVGEWILVHQQVPTTGIFSYTNADKTWVSHEWLSAVLLYGVFQYAGWAGLVFLTLLCLLASLLLVQWFLLKRLNAVQSLIFVLFAYLLMIQHILPRPHIFAIPLMTYWTARLIDASEKQTAPPFFILPLMILWVNLHGSFIVGIAFSLFFAAEAVFYAPTTLRKSLISGWGAFVAGTVLCAAITPHGVEGLLLPFQLNNQDFALSRISEWLSPDFHNPQPLELWLLSFLALVLLQGIKLPVFRVLFLLGLVHLSLKHIRHACDLLSVLSPLILATPLAQHWHSQPEMRFADLWPKTYKGIAVLAIYFAGLFFFLNNVRNIESDFNRQVQKVLQVLKPQQQQLGNVLNNYGAGDFLIHLDYQTFIDTRSELYGDKFMQAYFAAIELGESSKRLEALIAKYHITWTLFYTQEPINTYLATQPQWHKLYSDQYITAFIHQSVKLSGQTLQQLRMVEKQAVAQQKETREKNAALVD